MDLNKLVLSVPLRAAFGVVLLFNKSGKSVSIELPSLVRCCCENCSPNNMKANTCCGKGHERERERDGWGERVAWRCAADVQRTRNNGKHNIKKISHPSTRNGRPAPNKGYVKIMGKSQKCARIFALAKEWQEHLLPYMRKKHAKRAQNYLQIFRIFCPHLQFKQTPPPPTAGRRERVVLNQSKR